MSEALSTSPARAPRPLPTWLATIAPLALPSIAMSGPASWRISSGIAWLSAVVAEPAMGSTSTFQTSMVSTIHSARDQAAVVADARRELGGGVEPVVGEAYGVGDRARLRGADGRVRLLRSGAPREVDDGLPVDGTVVRGEERLHLRHQRAEVGHAAARAAEATHLGEDLLEGRALERVVVVGALTGRSGASGGVTHGVNGTHCAQPRALDSAALDSTP